MIKKTHFTVLLVILGSVALNLLNAPFSPVFFDDKEIFKYGGLVIFKGGVPYRDFFDHKPPLIYFLNALNWWASPWLPWVIDTLLILFASLLFYWLCRKNKLARPWLLPLIFNLLIRYSLVSFGNGMTREYTAVFLLIFFCVMQGSARYKYFILGLLAGLSFWMQQDSLLTLLPFLYYAVFISETKTKGFLKRRSAALIGGMITVSFPLFVYFLYHHALGWLWQDAFLFNLQAPGVSAGLIQKLKTIKHALHVAEFEMPFYTALILGVSALFLKNKKPALLYTALLALFLSFAGELLTGRLSSSLNFIYYLLPLAATIPVLVYTVFTETQSSFIMDKTAQLIFCLMLGVGLFLGTLRFASGFSIGTNPEGDYSNLPEMEWLQNQSLTDGQLYVFDDSNLIYLYNKYRILAPSPWIYHYFWNWSIRWDPDKKIFHSILQNLQSHKTRFILDCSEARNDFKNKSVYEDWQTFLQSHYTLILTDPSNRRLWRIQ